MVNSSSFVVGGIKMAKGAYKDNQRVITKVDSKFYEGVRP